MTCEQIQELLPWWHNGTLDESERARVQEHLTTCDECTAALEDVVRVLEGVAQEPCPSAEQLLQLAWSPDEAPPEVAAHVASCPTCREAVELARSSAELQEIDTGGARPANDAGPPGARAGWLVAASLLALVFGYQIIQQRSRLAVLERPTADAIVADVFSDRQVERSAAAAWSRAPAFAVGTPLVLLLHPTVDVAVADVHVITEAAETVFRVRGAEISAEGDLVISLPAGFLAAGRYLAEVVPADELDTEPEVFRFVLESPTSTNGAQ